MQACLFHLRYRKTTIESPTSVLRITRLLMDSLLLGVFADPRWLWIAAAAVLAALVRGFTGFGAAMVFVPVASAIYEPKVAVVVLFIVDSVITLPLAFKAIHQCRWPDVTCLAGGAALTIPLGVHVLLITDSELLRWLISLSILGLVAVMASGWRYKKRPPLLTCVGVGGVSGFAGGVANLYGPPIALFWLGGQSSAAVVRANIIVFFAVIAVIGGLAYWWNGLFSARTLALSIVLMPFYATAVWLGARSFRLASDVLFRWLALALIAVVAVASLPGWGSFWHWAGQ
jgi:uncharacterized membrane protein YfcA